jgi:hypothetical protein
LASRRGPLGSFSARTRRRSISGAQIEAVQEQQIEGVVEHAGRVACHTMTALLCIQLGGIASVLAGLFWFQPMVGAIATAAIAFIAIDLIWISEYWPSNAEDEE